ncbi:hypothetical protein [Desulfospira joergensenii]|uniref:hypothetical protein n=1 Tax=Desulfospira joergensenii TaxID=53329 RepID=UPI0003B6C954|nr:hypothetical protein [Desulfospira joergensenii]
MKKLMGIIFLGIMLMNPPAIPAGETKNQAAVDAKDTQVEGKAYFDSRTGHRYVKAENQTYMEFDRKGRFLKTVPDTLPLLLQSRSIHPISDENYILYKKCVQGKICFKSLRAVSPHPEGWYADKLLLAIN